MTGTGARVHGGGSGLQVGPGVRGANPAQGRASADAFLRQWRPCGQRIDVFDHTSEWRQCAGTFGESGTCVCLSVSCWLLLMLLLACDSMLRDVTRFLAWLPVRVVAALPHRDSRAGRE